MKVFKYISIITVLSLFPEFVPAQDISYPSPEFRMKDLEAVLSFLSSGRMEGRETGTRGAMLASDFIRVIMQNNGLEPSGDFPLKGTGSCGTINRGFFQNFNMIRYETVQSEVTLINGKEKQEKVIHFVSGNDYRCRPISAPESAEAPVVFAGYGISCPGKSYDDYKGLDVKGKIVVVLKGVPGHKDTLSYAWKKLGALLDEMEGSVDKKLETAEREGAVALIFINNYNDIYHQDKMTLININDDINQSNEDDPEYSDGDYILESDSAAGRTPCFFAEASFAGALFEGTGTDPGKAEKAISKNLKPLSMPLNLKRIRFSVAVKGDFLSDRNVVGVLYGRDTSRSIVIGAHYDHLGIRNDLTFYGADDNASGVAGMLALAKAWAGSGAVPPCNMIFAAWSAEEKGQLGSHHFVLNREVLPGRILMCLNMDMISRSAPEDSSASELSIGTRPESEELRKIATESNQKLTKPFRLDLWDVTGHSGSDYNYFSREGIPVMTFFSGYNADYHTTRDIAEKADFQKMMRVLELVNECLIMFHKTLEVN